MDKPLDSVGLENACQCEINFLGQNSRNIITEGWKGPVIIPAALGLNVIDALNNIVSRVGNLIGR